MGRHSRRGRPKADKKADKRTEEPTATTGATTTTTGGRPDVREEVPRPRPAYDAPRGAVAPPHEPYEPPYEPYEGTGVRGGHPEQREPGGAWGVPAQRGGPPDATRRPSAGAPARASNGPPRDAVRETGPPRMPRQEYIDAFDDDVFGTAGVPTGAAVAPPTAAKPEGAGSPPDPDGGAGREVGGTAGEDDGRGRKDRGGRGRAFTGVAAAAVTTVLAVVVAGQVADSRGDVRERIEADGKGERMSAQDSSRSDARPTPERTRAPSSKATTATYDDLMSRLYDLAPDEGGSGELVTVPGRDEAPGEGPVIRYRVDVEKGLPLDGRLFAEAVHRTLNDDRSWSHAGARAFERVSEGEVRFVITLAGPATTAHWCAKSGLDTTIDNVSCDSAATERVMINAYRWARGSETFGPERIREYREMLINHEVGHRLGKDHVGCPKDGALAPVMMQQTKYLTTGGATCRPNAWPFPDA